MLISILDFFPILRPPIPDSNAANKELVCYPFDPRYLSDTIGDDPYGI